MTYPPDRAAYRKQMLDHCMGLAKWDAGLALDAADWYEKNEPHLLENLRAKVDQLIRRNAKEGQAT